MSQYISLVNYINFNKISKIFITNRNSFQIICYVFCLILKIKNLTMIILLLIIQTINTCKQIYFFFKI